MNSSGIKRGVAAVALSALAVTGSPFIASSAQATTGDSFTVTYTGPALNGDTGGALVILRAQDGTITPSDLSLTSTSSTTEGSQNNGDQTAEIVDYFVEQDPSAPAFEFIKVYIATETNPVGSTATFRIFEDDNSPGTVNQLDTNEARQTVSITTAGPATRLDLTGPSNSSQPSDQESGTYTVTAYDAANRVTQLPDGDGVCYSSSGPGTTTFTETGPDTDVPNDGVMYATNSAPLTNDNPHEFARGTDTFTTNNDTAGSYTYTVQQCGNPTVTDSANNSTSQSANLSNPDYIDIVTAADSWDGYGDGVDGGITYVRVDQNTIRIDIDAPNGQAGNAVQANVNGLGDVTFNGGQPTASYSTTLDANGNGSVTISVDANTIQEFDQFTLSMNGFDQTFEFERAAPDDVVYDQNPYFCATGGSCTLSGTVVDQFGNPVTTGRVEVGRDGPRNNDYAPTETLQVSQVGPDGKFSVTFQDGAENPGATFDDVYTEYYKDQASNSPDIQGYYTYIEYRANGQGSDFNTFLNSQDTGAPSYDPSTNKIAPLSDTVADNDGRDEDAAIVIQNCDSANPTTTVSVDNGALILEPFETDLSEGSTSVTDSCSNFQNFGGFDSYRVIGTTAGLVTVTVDSANRTETSQLTVTSPNIATDARNVSVSGPATVPNGTTQFTDTILVTDAFGNPVQGVKLSDLNVQVSGPGSFKDGDVQTDANGMLNINIAVQSGAEGDITVTVTGVPAATNQFGAQADRLNQSSVTDDGEGLTASSNTGSATTTVEGEVVTPPCEKVNPSLVVRGRNNGAMNDKVVARAINLTAGATVRLFKNTANGLKLLRTDVMNEQGNRKFEGITDRNGRAYTKYIVKVAATECTFPGKGGRKVR